MKKRSIFLALLFMLAICFAITAFAQEINAESIDCANGKHALENEKITYPNGYMASGVGSATCSACGETEISYNPIFTTLGYSVSATKDSFALGVHVDREALSEYEASAGKKLDFGAFVGGENAYLSVENGALKSNGGVFGSLAYKGLNFLDIKVTGFNKSNSDKAMFAEFYIFDGEKITYARTEKSTEPQKITFNQVVTELDTVVQRAEALLKTKVPLYYNEDGSFRVLIIADAHMDAEANSDLVNQVKVRIKNLVDRENPDLVIFTGDNTITANTPALLRKSIGVLVGYIEEKKIPWCHVYGNHDHEGALSHEQQQAVYEGFEYCVSKSEAGLSSVGNCVLGIYDKNGELGGAIYLINSNTYAPGGGYDYIKDDQIEWYASTSRLLQQYNGGKPVKGMMAFHIPLIENNQAYNNRNNPDIVYEFEGGKNETICSSATDTNLLETIFRRGDVKAIVTGHDHVNDYMYNYMGVKLCSSPNVSDLTYYNSVFQGARVFDLNRETIDNIPTYVSYLIERPNPKDYEKYESGVVLQDFEVGTPRWNVSGLNSTTLRGFLTISVVKDKGQNGTKALKVERNDSANAEFNIQFSKDYYGCIGDNEYLVVWMDFTDIEFRKACVGFLSSNGPDPYRTDDNDGKKPTYYYLADGSDEWQALRLGDDGCFGKSDGSSVYGKCGYFAFRIEDMLQDGKRPTEDTLVTGFYMYLSIDANKYSDVPFYVDSIMLVDDYKTITNK